jgi:FlaA1/EpsC-like NDP-sugar epimerase
VAVTGREFLVRTGWAALDASAIAGASFGAAWLRFDLRVSEAATREVAQFAAAYAASFLLVVLIAGFVSRTHQRGTFEETAQIIRQWLIASLVTAGCVVASRSDVVPFRIDVPRSLPIVAPVLAIVSMFAVRFLVRSYRWGATTAREEDRKVIVYGAGAGGQQLVRALVRDRNESANRLVPVAILDDDPMKKRWRIEGVRVRGGADRLSRVVEATEAGILAVAIPSISGARLQELGRLAQAHGLELLVLPAPTELLGAARGTDLRRLDLKDLLGRRSVLLDTTAIAESIAGRRVLVTGAGGSIGSELARQIAKFGPDRLILLDRDESALHAVQMSLTGRALLDDGTLALCDIRDTDSLRAIFERERPQVVFHAAALKHLTLLEQFPVEGWKSNVLGTLNVLEAAYAVHVETFVNISTDKAADPTCVLGYSKRLAERLTAEFARRDLGTYVSVRFGNVLGSRGSVIEAFTAQIERGGPVTVTHPEVERYFMLIPEAAQLVLQASAIGTDGEVMVLDMGQPVKIIEVARQMISLSGKRRVEIVFTGLRPGEKLSEQLFAHGSQATPTAHPLVSRVPVPPLTPELVREHSVEVSTAPGAAMRLLAARSSQQVSAS